MRPRKRRPHVAESEPSAELGGVPWKPILQKTMNIKLETYMEMEPFHILKTYNGLLAPQEAS